MATRDWSEIKAKAAPETIERARRKTEAMLAVIELNELRKARRLTQEQLAERLGIRPADVSKMGRRAGLHVSTLRELVESMGGALRVTARSPDAEYELDYIGRAGG